MEAQESKAVEVTEEPREVTVLDTDLKLIWGLILTREWPVAMIPQVGHIKNVISKAVKVPDGEKD